ncbi:MAG: HYC_CC_PP family protein [Flavobacteriaceae bacterium]
MKIKLITTLTSLLLVNNSLIFNLNLHYCNDQLVAVQTVFEGHQGCGMESEDIDSADAEHFLTLDCCQDVSLHAATSPSVFELLKCNTDNRLLDFLTSPLPLSCTYLAEKVLLKLPLIRPPIRITKLYLLFEQWTLYG